MEAIKTALRLLRLVWEYDIEKGNPVGRAEQEYFWWISRNTCRGKDLIFQGVPLFGAVAAENEGAGRSLFRNDPPAYRFFMKDVNEELWKLGVH